MMFLFPSGGICYFPRGYHEFWMTKWGTKCDNHPPDGIRGIWCFKIWSIPGDSICDPTWSLSSRSRWQPFKDFKGSRFHHPKKVTIAESPNVDYGCCVGNSTIRCSRNGLTLEVQAIAVGILRKLRVLVEKNVRRSCWLGSLTPKRLNETFHKLNVGGGNSNVFIFHPPICGRFPFWLIFFQRGWNHQLGVVHP